MGSLTFLPPSSLNSQFLMAAVYFVIVCKELKIAQIAQINQQFLNLICANSDAFYELTHMLMSINVTNDVSRFAYFSCSYSEKIISRHSYSESLLEEKKVIYEILYLRYRSISIPMVFYNDWSLTILARTVHFTLRSP